jgi:Hemerythrin HHE cation binding domain/Protein of unknown function (DUF3618)
VSTSDPVPYPAESGSTEALRQEAARNRADLVRTVELLADRARPERLARPAVTVPAVAGLVGGLGVWVSMVRHRLLRQVAWVGGFGAAVLAFATARRAMAPRLVRAPMARGPEEDVVDLLLAQHREIVAAFDLVRDVPDEERTEAFAVLVELLRRHERAEQRVVHPVVRVLAEEAGVIAEARVEEEKAADRMLASLITNGVADKNLDAGLARLQQMVQDHAAQEESEEFALLRGHVPADQLRRMAGQVRRSP